MQAPAAEKDLSVDGGDKKLSLGIFVDADPRGLLITGLKRNGWCSAVGMVRALALLHLNAETAAPSTHHRARPRS